MKKVAFITLGCKVNAYETESMSESFKASGYEVVSPTETADIYVINTCSVTNIADRKSRQMIHRARKKAPDALIVAAGCYVQADPKAAKADPSVDLIIGTDKKSDIVRIVEQHVDYITDIAKVKEYDDMHIKGAGERTRAFVKIQDGCNQFCSYCLIPYVRGRVRSRSEESVLEEVKALADGGIREVVLTGIHLSSYGANVPSEWGAPLISLLRKVNKIEGIKRIRLGSLEPRIITREFAALVSGIDKLCPHFHLSLQSGCDETLARMNRHYTCEEYAEKLQILREYFDNPALTTDVIVGFPGETEEEFAQTVEFLKKIKLYEMHIFQYSLRTGTAAEKLPNRVDPQIKEKRSDILLNMAQAHKTDYVIGYIGKETELLIEETDDKYAYGYNREYVRLRIPKEGYKPGEIVAFIPTQENLIIEWE